MNRYHHKLYALLQASDITSRLTAELTCLAPHLSQLSDWWNHQQTAKDIASSADRLNLNAIAHNPTSNTACHPISGQTQILTPQQSPLLRKDLEAIVGEKIITKIFTETDEKMVFWWFWRFFPEISAVPQPDALLHPAHPVLPDCPVHSYQSTVSAIAGASLSFDLDTPTAQIPYLLIFSFSPVQEFIKASRKFLDFWAGSYLLHYLSAKLCWKIADDYGPDAIIVPSLWSQEIIDALLLKSDKPAIFEETFRVIGDCLTPAERFKEGNSLNTAGFPNVITAIVPGKAAAEKLGDELTELLTKEWSDIGEIIRKDIHNKVVNYLGKAKEAERAKLLAEVFPGLPDAALEAYTGYEKDGKKKKGELEKLATASCWEWRHLWKAQLKNTWEPYWSAIPLGHPEAESTMKITDSQYADWEANQQKVAHSPELLTIPSCSEKKAYQQLDNATLNVGLWWGSLQRRLQIGLQATKNTRTWKIPAAPGDRSTLSGKFSALHPWLNYQGDFREGGGLSEGSMRLFWEIMAKSYPGLFNGSERLNAIELTKRMAWSYGDVADSLGIEGSLQPDLSPEIEKEDADAAEIGAKDKNEYDFETQIRFPNLSSIAAARFLKDSPHLAIQYWQALNDGIKAARKEQVFSTVSRRAFYAKTLRDSQIAPADEAIKQAKGELSRDNQQAYNGVMFSSKWLADDMGLLPQTEANTNEQSELARLRQIVDQAHQQAHLSSGSPADWWAIVLADGDNMGQFVSGKKLEKYDKYVSPELIALGKTSPAIGDFLQETSKRMGPATHVGLNRALLDFSNRLVPYLTEQRFCGRVVYSGGDDVMSVLPLEDLPEYLLSLRAAWSGKPDPSKLSEFDANDSGYWHPNAKAKDNSFSPMRPHFTMGKTATMSIGVVIAYKSVPLPTVLESLWEAEGQRAKGMPKKNGLCFRVIYGNGNQLEALMSGSEDKAETNSADLLSAWWKWVGQYAADDGDKLSPLLYRLSEELPQRANVGDRLFAKAARVMMNRRENRENLKTVFDDLENWIDRWEKWAMQANNDSPELGTTPEDLGNLLRFSAFWIDKRVERLGWQKLSDSIRPASKEAS